MTNELCPCGQPLHYETPEDRERTEAIIREAGEYVCVYAGYSYYSVSRHYMALHNMANLEEAARQGHVQKLGSTCAGCG